MGLTFTPQARDILGSLAPGPKKRIKAALQRLADDPMDSHLDLKLLSTRGPDRMYRCRVQDYRIVFTTPPTHVMRIFHRRDGYGWMER